MKSLITLLFISLSTFCSAEEILQFDAALKIAQSKIAQSDFKKPVRVFSISLENESTGRLYYMARYADEAEIRKILSAWPREPERSYDFIRIYMDGEATFRTVVFNCEPMK
ncbi:hypothetical protein [Rariglobus hedericola]|uniref:Uncharacterized protein n=1 Tax=Rariglobus hedericola TaxID=2597822 RepID=A0A556QPQ0_9BACT|nr:hypothetical protein [Rariglobus hedericola]TSJ78611.1 hypothetical protein FPL22_04725 [Rariglobus hedericola]